MYIEVGCFGQWDMQESVIRKGLVCMRWKKDGGDDEPGRYPQPPHDEELMDRECQEKTIIDCQSVSSVKY